MKEAVEHLLFLILGAFTHDAPNLTWQTDFQNKICGGGGMCVRSHFKGNRRMILTQVWLNENFAPVHNF